MNTIKQIQYKKLKNAKEPILLTIIITIIITYPKYFKYLKKFKFLAFSPIKFKKIWWASQSLH